MTARNQKFWLIELLAYWEGEICTRHLCEFFRISRQQASKYLKDYQQHYPGSLRYNRSHKRYTLDNHFTSTTISKDVNEYLNWMTGIRANRPAAGTNRQMTGWSRSRGCR